MKQKTNSLDFLGKIVTVKMDRPIGTKHPTRDFIYPINYGFIPNTISGGGEELDAYIIGPKSPLNTFTGRSIAIIHRTNDDDDKLVVVPDGQNLSDELIDIMTNFQEKWYKHIIIRTR